MKHARVWCAFLVFMRLLQANAFGQDGKSADLEHAQVLTRVRDYATKYADRLHDFVCVQTTERSVDDSGSGRKWKPLETQQLEVIYAAHRESYRLLSVNGKSDNKDEIKQGYFTPSGEFGTAFGWIFDAKAAAAFDWGHGELISGNRKCVLHYRVPVETTTLTIRANRDVVPIAHHGTVWADCDTGAVTRIQIESQPASVRQSGHDLAIGIRLDVTYAPVEIDGQRYLLPESAEEIAPFGKRLTRSKLRFEQYRKFGARVNLTFDPQQTPPPPR